MMERAAFERDGTIRAILGGYPVNDRQAVEAALADDFRRPQGWTSPGGWPGSMQ